MCIRDSISILQPRCLIPAIVKWKIVTRCTAYFDFYWTSFALVQAVVKSPNFSHITSVFSGTLLICTNRKSYMGFRLQQNLMILNDLKLQFAALALHNRFARRTLMTYRLLWKSVNNVRCSSYHRRTKRASGRQPQDYILMDAFSPKIHDFTRSHFLRRA